MPLARMECAALLSHLTTQSLWTFSEYGFKQRRLRPLCHLIVRQQTWQEIKSFVGSSWAVDVGIANAISKPGMSQASYADQSWGSANHHRRPVSFACRQYRPGDTRQLIRECHAGNVVMGARCELCQPLAQAG